MSDTEETRNSDEAYWEERRVIELLGIELYVMMRATIAADIARYNRTIGEINAKYNRIIWKR